MQRQNSASSECPEQKVPVRNLFRIKHMEDDENKKIYLVGTFIQRIFHDFGSKFDGSDFFFKYRINGLPVGGSDEREYDECLKWRKTVSSEKRKTIEVKAPMDVSDKFDWFPFKVIEAKVMIELTSSTVETKNSNETTNLRPNLLVSNDKSNAYLNVEVERPQELKDKIAELDESKSERRFWFSKYNEVMDRLKTKLDKTSCYDFITPLPKVAYYHDENKNYCSKFEVSYILVEQGEAKFVQIVCPMILISVLNTINVMFKDDVDFGMSSTLALTAVFILPSIISASKKSSLIEGNNIYVIIIFVALTLSSISKDVAGTKVVAIVGMCMLWVSIFIPIINIARFYQYYYKTIEEAPSIRSRVKQLDCKLPQVDVSNYEQKYSTVEEFARMSEEIEQKKEEDGTDLWKDNKSPKGDDNSDPEIVQQQDDDSAQSYRKNSTKEVDYIMVFDV